MISRGLAAGASTGLTTTPQVIALTEVSADSRSRPVPESCWLDRLHWQVTSIASNAALIRCRLCADSAGDVPLTEWFDLLVEPGKTTATSGGALFPLLRHYFRSSAGTAGTLYVEARTNTGTLTGVPRVFYAEEL